MSRDFFEPALYKWPSDEKRISNLRKIIDDAEFEERILLSSDMERYNSYKTGRSKQERNFIMKMMKKYPKESLDPILDAMPCTKDKIPVFDITNPSGEPHENIKSYIKEKFENCALDSKKRYMDDCENSKASTKLYFDVMKVSREGERIQIDESVLRTLEFASQQMKECQKKMIGSLIEYCAHRRLERALLMDGVVVIPKSKDNIFELLTSYDIKSNATNLFSQMVTEKVSKLMLDSGSPTEEDKTLTFSFTKKEIKVPFIIVRVTHNKIFAPQHQFSSNFLTHQDKILKNIPQKRTNPEGRYTALALIQLGTDKIPPGKKVPVRIKFNDHFRLHNSFMYSIVHLYRNSIANSEASLQSYPGKEIHELEARRTLESIEEFILPLEKRIAENSRLPDRKPIYDPGDMKVQVLYPHNHCFVCHTSSHTPQECKEKGCRICYGKNHPLIKCSFKCSCKKLATHGIGECTLGTKVDDKRRASLLEARIKNTERNRIFST